MDKIKLYLKKYWLWILVGILILACLILIPSLFFHKTPIDKITDVIDNTRKKIDKVNDSIEVKKIETEIKTKVIEERKEDLLGQLKIINTINNDEMRRRKVLELHEKVKKFR